MSSPVNCDVCKKVGRRRMGRIAPEGWMYGESEIEDEAGDVEDTIYVYACSPVCATSFWKPGPGKLDIPPLPPLD